MASVDQLEESALGASDVNVKLNIFEGPLDLLLFLIRKNEIDIYDIPIEQVTRQYIEVLRDMKKLSLDVAGEFFVMAATLMYIKSRMLLPADEQAPVAEDENEDTDPRWELVEQLLEYKKIKQGAGLLADLIFERQNYLDRYFFDKDAVEERPVKPVDRMELWNTFNNVLRRLSEKLVQGQIVDEKVSVSDRMEFILSRKEGEFTFSGLFDPAKSGVHVIIATFLAMLELTRLKRLRLTQNAAFDEILCTLLTEEEAAAAFKEESAASRLREAEEAARDAEPGAAFANEEEASEETQGEGAHEEK